MIVVSGNSISIPKGDQGTVIFTFSGSIASGDSVKLFVAKNTQSTALISKTGTVGSDLKVSFSITGTESNITAGRYVYSLRLVRANGYDTPIKTGSFIVEEAVSGG